MPATGLVEVCEYSLNLPLDLQLNFLADLVVYECYVAYSNTLMWQVLSERQLGPVTYDSCDSFGAIPLY